MSRSARKERSSQLQNGACTPFRKVDWNPPEDYEQPLVYFTDPQSGKSASVPVTEEGHINVSELREKLALENGTHIAVYLRCDELGLSRVKFSPNTRLKLLIEKSCGFVHVRHFFHIEFQTRRFQHRNCACGQAG